MRSPCVLLSSSVPPSLHFRFLNPKGRALNGIHGTRRRPTCLAKQNSSSQKGGGGGGVAEKAAIASGLVAFPVMGWSLYTLNTTGCGLQPGPGGAVGAVEGASYLIMAGIAGWSVVTKAKTGSGLPRGPFGLLGAVEGLSFLSVLSVAGVFGAQFLQKGSIPGPLPGGGCF